MKDWLKNNGILMLLSAIVFVGGYFFLRLAYNFTDTMPFTQEILLIVLGTIATILITAMLLNKQTSVELEKEQSVKFIELKTQTYQKLIDTIEDIMLSDEVHDNELTKLRFHTHRLAIFASPAVLKEYRNFLNVFNDKIAKDKNVSMEDADLVSDALAKLTIYIRADLVGELDAESEHSRKQISQQIMENVK
jgi:type II secretory pathway pseudopilin PulG